MNGDDPAWVPVTVEASTSTNTNTFSQSGHLYLPPAEETLTYDLDGNLTGDGRWTYVSDGESCRLAGVRMDCPKQPARRAEREARASQNRLIEVTTRAAAIAGGVPDFRLHFVYDARGRRIRKLVERYDSVTSSLQVESDLRFIYDGWNLLAEIEMLPTAKDAPTGATGPYVKRSYVWGLDVSGTWQGAGGVGGLLAVRRHERGTQPLESYWAATDLNGNVIGLCDTGRAINGTGSTAGKYAVYEYDPFGQAIRVSEPEEDLNPFRFSTKYQDIETGLYYYGFRYYNPATGRWLNRDPIGEEGGLNLYGMVGNNALEKLDPFGLKAFAKIGDGKTPHQVAIQAIKEVAGQTATDNLERGGLILQCGSFYVHTPITIGTEEYLDLTGLINEYRYVAINSIKDLQWIINEEGLLSCQCEIVADYHTHPPKGKNAAERSKQNYFSDIDYQGMKAAGWHAYLGAPDGSVKFMHAERNYSVETWPKNYFPPYMVVLFAPVVGQWK
jgi:RHS repeat-associated protein